MKKIWISIAIMLSCMMTACNVDRDTRLAIVDALKEESIISDTYQFEESYTKKFISYVIDISVYDVYKNDQGDRIVIQLSIWNSSNSHDADYQVSIYDVTEIRDEIDYVDEEEVQNMSQFYVYGDRYSLDAKYRLSLHQKYYAKKKSSLFRGEYYSFEMIDDN